MQVLALGELLSSLSSSGLSDRCLTYLFGETTVRLSGVFVSCEAQEEQEQWWCSALSPGFSSCNYRALSRQRPGCSGGGPLTCSAWGHPAAGVSLMSFTLQASGCPGGSTSSLAVSLAPCAPRPVLLELHSWQRSCLCAEPLPEPPMSCSWGHAAPYIWSLCSADSELFPGPCTPLMWSHHLSQFGAVPGSSRVQATAL